MSQRQEPIVDRALLDATAAAVARWGLAEVTLDRVAVEAGMSRATIYRRGVTREDLVAALTAEAADTYRRAMLPALARSGSAAERLRHALEALCDTADEHLYLLAGMFLARGEVFHQPGPDSLTLEVFAEPFERLLRDGAVDGTLRHLPPQTTATVLFNLVGWGYIHLRAAHQWGQSAARSAILDLVLQGLLGPTPSSPDTG
ncbi:TetR/AcrR family transcriptional regulator [Skermania sp. ID1734]|uniref:TetR/AcrR family transcriptional regulator n=1 Tax=Skermania sp. ID1734 TaxID=2597516 RepID=UPI00117E77F9|nr:TetR/AcrR family transcriptional regulator [Skermania sp. ID1734]TSD93789.1 TetR/AcrR family transcriptional regulator [Skermania sp. ID1734]